MTKHTIRLDKVWVVKWILVAVLIWAVWEPATYVPDIFQNIPFALDYLIGMFPPDPSVLPSLWGPLLETLRMALVGTALSTLFALPLSFLAAKNTTPSNTIYLASRGLLSFLRAMPAMIWAMLFISLAGLGPLAGILGITFHATGALGKMFSESIEAAEPTVKETLEAMRLDGATEWQAIRWGIIPSVMPLLSSYSLYRLESMIRTSTIMGLVGAGGLGLELTMAIRMFRRQEALMIMIVILGLVLVVDYASSRVRRYILR